MFSQVEALEATLEAMGTPTPEQSALLKVTMDRVSSTVQSRETVWTLPG
ncbi:hypothetical protein [Nostoc sp.]